MKNKVLAIDAEAMPSTIQKIINDELEKGWLIELFYEARRVHGNIILVTLYKEETANGDK